MSASAARVWIVVSSLVLTFLLFTFTAVAPAFGYPLLYEQVPRLAEIILPVLLGYLGSATTFLFQRAVDPTPFQGTASPSLITLLVIGPTVIFFLAVVAILFAFAYSNRSGAESGIGMNLDQLAAALATCVGLLSVTTNVIVSALFAVGLRRR